MLHVSTGPPIDEFVKIAKWMYAAAVVTANCYNVKKSSRLETRILAVLEVRDITLWLLRLRIIDCYIG